MVDICGEGHSQKSAFQKGHRHIRPACLETEAGTLEGIRRTAPGRVRSSSSWLPELLQPGKAQNAGPAEFVLLWSTQNPESEWLRPGKCTQLRACSLESSLETEQCIQGEHMLRPEANLVWQEHCECSPQRPVTFV